MNAYTILNSQFTVFTDPVSGKKLAKCSYCDSLLKYHHSTSSLTYHLRSKHAVFAPTASVKSSQDIKPNMSSPHTSAIPGVQHRSRASPQNYEIALQLTKWIAADARPLDMLDDEGLKHLLRVATGSGNFVMPTKSNVAANIEQFYHRQKFVVSDLLMQAEYISLTTDSWISGDDSFSSIRCHYISPNWKYCSLLLGIEHNADKCMTVNIDEHFSSLMMNWRIQTENKLFHLVINSLSPVNDSELIKLEQTPCLAHLLLLSINNAMVACSIDDKIDNEILGYYNGYVEENPTKLEALLLLDGLPMGQDAATAWRRTFLMVDFLLKNKAGLHNQPSAEEWAEFSSIHKLFEPLQRAIAILGGNNYTSASSILPLIAYLRQQMTATEVDTSYAQEFKLVFISELNSYVGNTIQSQQLQLATAFDIRYKRLLSLPKEKRADVWATLNDITRKAVQSTFTIKCEPPEPKKARSSILSLASDDGEVVAVDEAAESEVYLSEFEMYKHLPQINDDDQCPLQWWKDNIATYPTLSKIAKKYLAIPATSVPCEQLFSNGRELINRKRSALLPDDVNHLLCLSDWLAQSSACS